MSHHTPETHYAVLGIEPYADISEIKSAYKARALEIHPDKNGGTSKAKEAFQHLVNAYEVLSDVTKRRSYDQTLAPAYFSQSWFAQSALDLCPHFCAPTWPTQPPPSSNPPDWPLPSETFTNGKPADWWRKYEDEERQSKDEEEEEQARKCTEEQQNGRTHEMKKEKLYGEASQKQRKRAEQTKRREREIKTIARTALRLARELEEERMRKQGWKGMNWGRGKGQSVK